MPACSAFLEFLSAHADFARQRAGLLPPALSYSASGHPGTLTLLSPEITAKA